MTDNFLNEMELEQQIKSMPDRQLLEFTARRVYDVCLICADHSKRIKRLEGRNRKEAGIIGGAGAFIGLVIASVVDYFLRR